ncbi:MAG: glycosyl hydrolase [bacterium]|nr:glycosyl hydrolase [bacterium]
MGLNKKIFQNPGPVYRTAPFWSWNDKLVDAELIRQIHEMKKQGFGGFFMHSRVGLITPYLSAEWMNRIRTAVKEAKKNGMFAWLYDEDKWPSGFAGGIVPKLGKTYRMHALGFDQKTQETKVLTMPMGLAWFNGTSYVDLLNPDVVDVFLKSTHQAYSRVCGTEFSTVVPGIFTDEPCCLFPGYFPLPCVPWTSGFPEYFKNRNGYNIKPYLNSLFLNRGEYCKIRFDFWNTMTDLFIESFSKRIYDWCEKHKLQLTGHFMAEDTLAYQIQWIGAAMPHYEYMHQPGMDHLGRNIDNIMTAKQVSSVAHQLGKPRVLSEAFGCSGQNMSFLDRKWIADWHFIHGINFINEHLCLYSMQGERKRDYPPNLYYQQPWWEYNRFIQDYFARLSYVLSQGKRVTQILVLHPIGSAWSVYSPLNMKPVDKYHKPFADVSQYLLETHWDYDYGDEKLLAKYGKINGNSFCVGKQKYKVVIIPPSLTWQKITLALLEKFQQAGGKIIKMAPYPTLVDGKKDKSLNERLTHALAISSNLKKLDTLLEKLLPRDIRIVNSSGKNLPDIWEHHRQIGNDNFYFLANMNNRKGYDAMVDIPLIGKWECWDATTGKIVPIDAESIDQSSHIQLPFSPAGSYLLRGVTKSNGEVSAGAKSSVDSCLRSTPSTIAEQRTIYFSNTWDGVRKNENALTLDYGYYKIGKGRWSQRLPGLKVAELVQKQNLGMIFVLRYEFTLAFHPEPSNRFWLVVETPEKYTIHVNHHRVVSRTAGEFWYEIKFKKIEITEFIQLGKNGIELTGMWTKDLEIESGYIIGDFAVRAGDDNQFQLIQENTTVRSADLVKQGYPFYAGTFWLKQEFQIPANKEHRIFLELDRIDATVCEVWINHQKIATWFWSPYRIEITEFIQRDQSNLIALKLVNTLHNLLGPHHHQLGEIMAVGPHHFRDWKNWTDAYYFVPFGIKNAKIVVE